MRVQRPDDLDRPSSATITAIAARRLETLALGPRLLVTGLTIAIMTSLFYGRTFFRDFAIIFEGGYRISLGQIPYRDFYMPVGPVTMYLQAFTTWLLGATSLALLAHAILLASLISLLALDLGRKHFGRTFGIFFALFLIVSYNGVWGNPWYNETAYFFFVVSCLLIIYKIFSDQLTRFDLGLLSVLSALAFFSKQDMLIMVPMIAAYAIASGKARTSRVMGFYVAPFLAMLALTILALQSNGDFMYWFNFGQAPHESRLELSRGLVLELLSDWRFFIIVAAAALLALVWSSRPRLKSVLLCLIVVTIVPLITTVTSGLAQQARLQSVPLIVFLLLLTVLGSERTEPRVLDRWAAKRLSIDTRIVRFLVCLLFFLVLLVLVRPSYVVASAMTNAIVAGRDYGIAPLTKLAELNGVDRRVRIEKGAYRGMLAEREVSADLERIRGIISANDRSFINMSELTFLYADFSVEPPVGFPLWFDHGISFFDAQYPFLTTELVARAPRVILLQDAHNHKDEGLQARLRDYYEANGYEMAFSARAPRPDRNIDVFVLQR